MTPNVKAEHGRGHCRGRRKLIRKRHPRRSAGLERKAKLGEDRCRRGRALRVRRARHRRPSLAQQVDPEWP